MNEKFNKNANVEKLTKKVVRGVRLIVIGPLYFPFHFVNAFGLVVISYRPSSFTRLAYVTGFNKNGFKIY